MKKLFTLLCLIGSLYAEDLWDKQVHIMGDLDRTMNYEGYGESFFLKKLEKSPSLYAIGLKEHLQGEIQIFDSKVFISSVGKNGRITLNPDLKTNASFLVYANVPQWVSFKIPSHIYTKKQFEEYLNETADEYGIDTYEPFPFLIEGKVKANEYRIFTHNPNDTITSYGGTCACDLVNQKDESKKKYIPLSVNKTMTHASVTILGFHTLKRGTITEQYSYTNMNFVTKDKKLAGHCKNIMIGSGMILKLPKIKQP